ncbi:methionyl-tRNA formyltransferase [Bacillus sp. FJAT-52991]|uniref:Methionyl-tRNA formyltransferase n=1 Tax=Bacillus kandeliae TaxID=3129297 RepID=A0ABZ2N5E6_9BACI
MNIVIAYNQPWYEKIADNIFKKNQKVKVFTITDPSSLNEAVLEEIDPYYIFFPHWSYIIKEDIYSKYKCVIFHMTDLPFGRGGSPLQNLISRGIYETKISALQCVKELDAGPIYLKKSYSLFGNAEEIYMRASDTIEDMIQYIIEFDPKPKPQQGEVVEFARRTPEEGNIENVEGLQEAFDYIRMLDAEGYPKAFVEVGNFIIEFERASLKKDHVHADVKIKLKEGK